MGDVSVMSGVYSVASVAVGIIEVEEISVADDVVFPAALLGLVVVDQLAQVGGHVGSGLDVLHRLHAPTATVLRLEDAEVH